MKTISHSVEETKEVAKAFIKTLSPLPHHATIIELVGDLGAGKTTFTQNLAQELQIPEIITSPTFVIQKRYVVPNHPQFKTLIHIDAYRLENPNEITKLGWENDLQNPENLIVVEWPNNIQEHIKNSIQIYFNHIDETTREIKW